MSPWKKHLSFIMPQLIFVIVLTLIYNYPTARMLKGLDLSDTMIVNSKIIGLLYSITLALHFITAIALIWFLSYLYDRVFLTPKETEQETKRQLNG